MKGEGEAAARRRQQELMLDGIEVSLFAGQVVYERLRQEVLAYSQTSMEDRSRANLFGHLMLIDAWSFVDVANRLRACVEQTPGLKQNAPVTSILKDTEEILKGRNFGQHIESEAPEVAKTGRTIWGSLSWSWADEEGAVRGEVRTEIAIIGRLAASAGYPLVNPAGKRIKLPVDLISLTAGGVTVNLSAVAEGLSRFGMRYARAVEAAKATGEGASGAPLLIVLENDG